MFPFHPQVQRLIAQFKFAEPLLQSRRDQQVIPAVRAFPKVRLRGGRALIVHVTLGQIIKFANLQRGLAAM